jgi:hypothetical protein
MSRRRSEVLKTDGKPKMTGRDGYELAIGRSGALGPLKRDRPGRDPGSADPCR